MKKASTLKGFIIPFNPLNGVIRSDILCKLSKHKKVEYVAKNSKQKHVQTTVTIVLKYKKNQY